MLLAAMASRRATMGNSGKEKALQQLTRMGGKMNSRSLPLNPILLFGLYRKAC